MPGMDLSEYMAENGLGDEAVAAEMGCDRTTITKIRLGQRGAGPELALRLVEWSGRKITHEALIRTALNGRRGAEVA